MTLGFDVIIWGIVSSLVVVLWYFIRKFSTRIIERLDTMVEQNEKLASELVALNANHNALSKRVDVAEHRLNDHSDRIREIELEHAKNYRGCKAAIS